MSDTGVFKVEYRACPECGLLLGAKPIELAVIDLDCPRCGKAKQSQFEVAIYEIVPLNVV